MTKICADCRFSYRHIVNEMDALGYFCHHPLSESVDIVSGITTYKECKFMRMGINSKNQCGVDGSFWVKKEQIEIDSVFESWKKWINSRW